MLVGINVVVERVGFEVVRARHQILVALKKNHGAKDSVKMVCIQRLFFPSDKVWDNESITSKPQRC
jgi:hypothetical protein